MASQFVIPLLITCIAVWVNLGSPLGIPDELPRLLSAIIGVTSSLCFFATAPWLVQLSLIVILLIFGNFYLRNTFGLR